ncbi:MAG: hypothetical protein JOY90_25240 [Bradyrhizobium sp.]|uniref:hypothetical protein n=1 Tax=Bradyrhizobium sp. TaxID=376 RepID=UPI001D7EEE1E|nr:hypothetical protein [Bradyrhizobium sp.]MBV9563720.1 hypothetical protein [Bradyrhizobium sp.]
MTADGPRLIDWTFSIRACGLRSWALDCWHLLTDRRLLVVLDYCELVVEVVAVLTVRILRDGVGPNVLVTSRETLPRLIVAF